METPNTILCSNCTRQIPAVNFALHENHCKRNITKCPKCQQPITAQEKASHEKLHEEVTCECGEVMEQQLFEEHFTNNCPNRDIICTYCELPIKCCDLESHQSYCGSRTDICTICNQYVTLMNMDLHVSSNCEFPPKRKSSSDRLDLLRQEVLKATQLGGSTFGLTCTRCNHSCQDLEELQTHLTTQCPMSPFLHGENEEKIPCEYCNQLVTISNYMEHSTTCGLESEIGMLDDHDYKRGGALRRQKKQERKLQAHMALKQSLKSEKTSSRSMKHQPPPVAVKTENSVETSPATRPQRGPKNPNRVKASRLSAKASKEESTEEISPAKSASNDNQIDLTVQAAPITISTTTTTSNNVSIATTTTSSSTDNNTPSTKVTKAPARLKATRPPKQAKPPRTDRKQPRSSSTTTVIDLTASDNSNVSLPDTTGIAVQGISATQTTTTTNNNRNRKQTTKRPTARTAA